MKFRFSAFTALILVIATSFNAKAGTYSPVLGDMLSGNPVSSADGAFNPFLIYETDFVGLGVTGASYYQRSGGVGVQAGDTMVIVSEFENLAGSLTGGGVSALGAGAGAIVWYGEVVGVDGDDFNIQKGGTAGVKDLFSGASDAFATLLVGESFDFANSTLAQIDTALTGGSLVEYASFDVSTTDFVNTNFDQFGVTSSREGGSGCTPEADLDSKLSLALDVQPGATEFWTIDRTPGDTFGVESSASYPYGSFGNELYLNYDVLRFTGPNTAADVDYDFDQATANGGKLTGGSGNGFAAMNPVPEPSTLAIMGCMGIAGFVGKRRKNRKRA